MRLGPLARGARVLMYHGIGAEAPGDARYVVSAERFAAQLEAIRAAGHRVVSLAALRAAEGAGARPPVVLTFDDGRQSDFTGAYPGLRERGLHGEFFVNPGTVGRPGYVTWPQLREMAAAGLAVQSHAHDHVYLTRLDARALDRQLRDSRHRIEDEVGAPVRYLAAPYGDCSRRVVEAALAVGYHAVCTSSEWPARPGGRTVNRIAIYASTTTSELQRLLAGDWRPYLRRAARAAAVYPVKQALLRVAPGRLGRGHAEAA